MNRIYKVIWSNVKHGYIVASEIAKSHGKSGRTGGMKKLLLATLAAATLSCGGFVGFAEVTDLAVSGTISAGGNISSEGTITAKGLTIKGDDNTTVFEITKDTFSLGSVSMKIQNVKDGDVTENSKDAVNGGQLYGVKTALEAADTTLSNRIGAQWDCVEGNNYLMPSIGTTGGYASVYDNLRKLDSVIGTVDTRTGGISRNEEGTETTIEDKVKIDSEGNVSGVKNLSVESIETTGDATIGKNLEVKGESTFDGKATFKNGIDVSTNTTSFKVEEGSITDRITEGDNNQNTSTASATETHRFMTNGTQSSVTLQTAGGISQLIVDGDAHNKVESTVAGGTSFINSNANTPITKNGKTGTAVETNIKGNTISTGEVTMDFATVEKDLGVGGDATIEGKTTTGTLEVTGESELKGKTTIGTADTNADLIVHGNSTVTGNSTVGGTLDVTGNATFHNNVEAKSYTVTDTGIRLDETGLDMDDHKITGLADGDMSPTSTDAVNGRQLYNVKRDLETQIDKVGANAAAMANLKPLDFDADAKWNLAGAVGNYGSETAAALGIFYRPNEDVMLNVSTAFGTGENMVGGGVSVRLGKGGHSKRVTRAENEALKAQVEVLTARMDALLSVLNPKMSREFPDVPENHWAYEAVSRLAGNGIVEGYPDGEFHGDRTMTRYEMAEIIYNAFSKGAQAEKDLVEEFKPELQAMAASQKA